MDNHSTPDELANVTHKPVRGNIRISPAVLIQLMELTVNSVEGVSGLRSLRKHYDRREPENGAHSHDNGKVAVSVSGDQIDASVSIAIIQGNSVSGITEEIRKRIGFAAGSMLGMTVRTADIYVDEITSVTTPS